MLALRQAQEEILRMQSDFGVYNCRGFNMFVPFFSVTDTALFF